MGKMYAQVVSKTKLEIRTKKDGTGTYEYADLSLQPFGFDGQPMTHERWDGYTGQSLGSMPDTIRFDAIRERAKQLEANNYQVGETVIIDVRMMVNRFGTNEVTVVSIQRYQQQPAPQPNNYQPFKR